MNQSKSNHLEKEKKLFHGLWPALLTPLNDNGAPNLGEIEKITELMISQELDGLYILGSTGQGILLNENQRKKVTEVVTSLNNGRLPIIVQVGSLTTAESVKLARHAADNGAHGISSVGPIYYGSSDGTPDMAIKHYRQIAEASDLPFFPYQLGEGKFGGSISSFVDKLLKIPHIAGMKLTTGNLLEISSVFNNSKGKLILFSGADELMCHAAICGTSGAIGTFYNLWGQECKKVRSEFVNGDVGLGTSFMLAFQEVIADVLPNIWTFLQQSMLLRYGITIGKCLAPLGNTHQPWPEKQVIEIIEKITNASQKK